MQGWRLSAWRAEKTQKTVASPEKLPPARKYCRQPDFSKNFKIIQTLSKISNCQIAEKHYLDVSTPSTES
jgi:hypothetical protein